MLVSPATPLTKIQRASSSTPRGQKGCEEKIRVTVRIRPLSRREQALYDLIAWESSDGNTIIYKNQNQERGAATYVFDRVFDPACSTQKVYEEGAKDVALSALKGINSTIFAYGQTSSGKTYTMRGITYSAIKDIYKHIEQNPDMEFALKMSALEIYNENVHDLLNLESGSLRLLDDPEKGTIVDKLVEEVVRDSQHLQHLINICEAQRQVGETALNDKSSRSHQIIRLTIQSSLQENSGHIKSLIATLNLVDLAGSERASQTNAGGTRLKEGSHINRSLLTLMNVIRKLSVEKRSAHIPYRDSKLTRILQHSLGGNARTAIICTVSAALSHVEQTKNTLSFATSAKEVTNRAQVNMVEPEKRLVKHLQKEVARLEAELRCPDLSSTSDLRGLLREKDMKIEKMEEEMKELKRQRDLAYSQLDSERKARKEMKGIDQDRPSGHSVRRLAFEQGAASSVRSTPVNNRLRSKQARKAMLRQSITSTDPCLLVNEIRKLDERKKQLDQEATRVLEILHKEVTSNRIGSQEAAENLAKLLSEIKDMKVAGSLQQVVTADKANLQEEITRLNSQENDIMSLEHKLKNVQESIDKLVLAFQMTAEESSEYRSLKKKKAFPISLSNGSNMQNIIRAPCSPLSSSRKPMEHQTENMDPNNNMVSYKESPSRSQGSKQSRSINVKKMERMFRNAAEENIRSIKAYVTELKERVAKLQYQKQLLVCQVLELEKNESAPDEEDMADQSPAPWPLLFEDERKQIIMLWHLCHVSIIHRTQFYLLFQGDPSDQIYMEVELRRLNWLEQHFAELGNASPALLGDDPAGSVSSSIKALTREREYLAKRVSSKLTAEERERLYEKWEIPPIGKQRRQQLVDKLWSDPLDMENVQESTKVVAKLVGFCESGEQLRKEMFQLNFMSPNDKKSWAGWNLISNLFHL